MVEYQNMFVDSIVSIKVELGIFGSLHVTTVCRRLDGAWTEVWLSYLSPSQKGCDLPQTWIQMSYLRSKHHITYDLLYSAVRGCGAPVPQRLELSDELPTFFLILVLRTGYINACHAAIHRRPTTVVLFQEIHTSPLIQTKESQILTALFNFQWHVLRYGAPMTPMMMELSCTSNFTVFQYNHQDIV